MQKVSKQSLAMLALSILLAISIALTFTFAAMQDSKKAQGSITFSGEASVTWAGGEAGPEGFQQKYSFDNDDFTFTTDNGKTVATLNVAALTTQKVTFSNTATTALTWKIEATDIGSGIAVVLKTGLTGTLSGGTEEKTLAQILESVTIADADNFESATFTLTASIGAAAA